MSNFKKIAICSLVGFLTGLFFMLLASIANDVHQSKQYQIVALCDQLNQHDERATQECITND